MALTDDYEPVRVALLNQQPLPTLEAALPRLKLEETRLGLLKKQVDFAFVASDKNAKICRHCHQSGHLLPEYPIVECRQ